MARVWVIWTIRFTKISRDKLGGLTPGDKRCSRVYPKHQPYSKTRAGLKKVTEPTQAPLSPMRSGYSLPSPGKLAPWSNWQCQALKNSAVHRRVHFVRQM